MTFAWADFRSAEPDFADTVRRRFEKYPHHVLATLRKDGSSRVSGLEVTFLFGELWLGMMPNSLRARDLPRDPRFAAEAGTPLPFHLFRVELSEVVRTGVEGEELVVRIWHPGRPPRTVRRGNGDGPPHEEGI
ncbi:pyridoxamine 5'-phosphate oxidase family protein [Streptomyces sp. NPDC056672]|uniref:pyridoxamine 5'-phosphate oxidase family protein n=1 Tax=Streptomyces sp. NPDC056672 TaxID=3345906 RepID=UPI0036A0E697